MPYPKPTLRERLLLPFRMIYWRWFWRPVDYDADPDPDPDAPDPAGQDPRDRNHGYRGQDPRP